MAKIRQYAYTYQRPKPKRYLRRFLLWFFLLALLSLLAYGIYSYVVIVNYFSAPIKEPAKIYAPGVTFELGERLDKNALKEILTQYQLKRVTDKSTKPPLGYFQQTKGTTNIRLHSGRHIIITIENKHITTLLENSITTNTVTLPRLFVDFISQNEFKDYQPLPLSKYPKKLIAMLLAMEDSRFYDHHGIDFFAIQHVIYSALFKDKAWRGASTITQQLVKNTLLTNKRSIWRKLQEFILALLLDYRFSKDFILQRYLNTVYLGQDGKRAIHGFALASQYYFQQDVKQLTEEKLALLVAMLKGAFAYHPTLKAKRAKKRRNLVLSVWAKNHQINKSKLKKLQNKALSNNEKKYPRFYSAAIDLARRQLKDIYQISDNSNLDITLSLDIKLQNYSQKKTRAQLKQFEKNNENIKQLQSAVVIIDQASHHIKTIIGDRYNRYAVFNRALDAKRQIGSLIKPAIYLTALQKSNQYNLLSTIDDSDFSQTYLQLSKQNLGNVTSKQWQPNNFDHQKHGETTILKALSNSYNIAAVKLGLALGINPIIDTLKKTGIRENISYLPSLLLGALPLTPMQVMQVYQGLLLNDKKTAMIIKTVKRRSKTLPITNQKKGKPFQEKHLYLLRYALENVVKEGTAKSLKKIMKNTNISAKTGSTNGLKDSWFVGLDNNYLSVIWLGRDDNQSTMLSGAKGALRLYGHIHEKLVVNNQPKSIPNEIKQLKVGFNGSCAPSYNIPYLGNKPTSNNRLIWQHCPQ